MVLNSKLTKTIVFLLILVVAAIILFSFGKLIGAGIYYLTH